MRLPTPFETFFEILFSDFQSKKKVNPSFSQRAYARYLGIATSTLANLMKKKFVGDAILIKKIGKKVQLSDDEILYFILLTKIKRTKEKLKKQDLIKRAVSLNTRFNTMSDDDFSIIASWYHFAVMELIKRQDAVLDPKWIAEKLQIKVSEAKNALEGLEKLGIIKIHEGALFVLKDFISLPTGKPLPVALNYHETMIKKSLEAAKTQTKEERNFSSLTLRFRKSDMSRVGEMLRNLRRDFSNELEAGSGHDSVYALNVQFIRLDRD